MRVGVGQTIEFRKFISLESGVVDLFSLIIGVGSDC